MDHNSSGQQRELVYCHPCENEWYRDEHGIICPDCQSDFTEIIEANHDPREEAAEEEDFHSDFNAPDPDEDDIGDFEWQNNEPGQPPGGHFHGTFTRNIRIGPDGRREDDGQGGGLAGGLLGMLGPALQGLLGGPAQNPQPYGQRAPEAEQDWAYGGQHRAPQQGYQESQNGGTYVRQGAGPGYSFTITSSTNSNLFPRDAYHPQPFQHQPNPLDAIMQQMIMNIGAVPGHAQRGPIFIGGPANIGAGGPRGAANIPGLLQLLGITGHDGVHGDAVYSQEALDQVVTQLMEQHQAGNAPGPASEQAIESLSRRKITEMDAGDSGTADCSICMDEAEIGTVVTELPCGHWFHHDCVKAWLTEHDTCPHCRQGIMPKDGPNTNRPRQPNQPPLHDMHSPEYQLRGAAGGGYPFPRQNSGSGSVSGNRFNPFNPSESSDARRSASPRAERSQGMFSRMREAFSPRDNGPGGSGSGSSGANNDGNRQS